jgi:stage IV sporulation protein FB
LGWEDRDYHRDREPAPDGPLGKAGHWLIYGRVYLFSAFGIRVNAHSSLIITIALILLFGMGNGFVWQDRVVAASMLFTIVLLHEFGHCFAARYVRGEADEIIMHPLGGLALTRPPHEWKAHFITVAGGPAVNVLVCLVAGIVLFALRGQLPWLPFAIKPFEDFSGWTDVAWWSYWVYQTSWSMLLFNLMPVFPLDGGQLLRSLMWPIIGFYRATMFCTTVGISVCIIAGMVAIATMQLMLLALCVMGLILNIQVRRAAIEAGADAFDELDYSNQNLQEERRQERTRQAEHRRKEQEQLARQAEEQRVDEILAKISKEGKQSLSRSELKFLQQATENRRHASDRRRPPPRDR